MKKQHASQPSARLRSDATVASAAYSESNLAFKWNKWVIREILWITIIIIFPLVTNATLWLVNDFPYEWQPSYEVARRKEMGGGVEGANPYV